MDRISRAPLPDGSAFGTDRFIIEKDLGEGSMGSVYLAFDRERQTRVALKTLRRIDASGIYRFKREFRALADVSHPNLVQFFELFSSEKDWFYTMEYVQGDDFLTHVLGPGYAARSTVSAARRTRQAGVRSGANRHAQDLNVLFPCPLDDVEALRNVLRQVTQGLIALHAAGKLHRDLKPDNVLVTPEGRAVVLDFGVAFELHQDSHGTLEAGVMGTPAYMSPEQAASGAVDEKTDFYALGAMLYEALTGQVPFDGAYTEVLQLKQREDPRAPSELCSEVPSDLEALAMRLLARDPAARPSGSEILAALGGAKPPARPSQAPQRISTELYGREFQLAELKRAFDSTMDGSPVLVLIDGASGMGKTTLVDRFLEEVRADGNAIVLSGRCYEHEMVPFKALDSVIDALSRYLGGLAATEATEVMPKDVHALAQLFPVLSRVDAVRRARRRGRKSSELRVVRRLAVLALKELLARITMREPLVLFIDDLHWGDVDSARVLAELLSGDDRPALLLVCTYRGTDRERSACLNTLFELLRDRPTLSVRKLTLAPLTELERTELARRLLGEASSEQLALLARESRGSPYLMNQLVQLVRHERASASDKTRTIEVSLERALSDRFSELSTRGATVLELAAVAGRPLSDEIIAQLTSPDLDLSEALIELRRARLVRGVGTGNERAIVIDDEGVRAAVLARMDPGLVLNWHRRLATAIESSREPDLEALTEHLVGAEEFARAGIHAIRAASQAMNAMAFDKAASLYEIAARCHADGAWRQELLQQSADALVSAGRSTRAAEAYLRAAEGVAPELATVLRRKAGIQLVLAGRWHQGAEVLAQTLGELGVSFPENAEQALRMTQELLPQLSARGLQLEAKRPAEIPAKVLERLDALWSVVQATFATNPVVAQPLALRHLLDALAAGERTRAVMGLCVYFIIIDLAFSSIAGKRPRSLQAAEALARDLDDPRCKGWIAFARGYAYQGGGLLKPAVLELLQAEQIFREHCSNVQPEVRACRMQLARLLAMQAQLGDLAGCRAWAQEAEDNEDLLAATRLRLATTPCALLEDDVSQAKRMLEVPAGVQSDPMDLTAVLIAGARTAIALYQADLDELLRIRELQEQLRRSPLFGVPIWRSDFLVNRARVLSFLVTHAHADAVTIAALEELLTRIDGIGLECHVDHVRLARASLAWLHADREQALGLLDAILTEADKGGDSRFVRACARLRKGQIAGGEVGAEWCRDAVDELRQLGVKNPVSFARLYAPGFE